MSVTELIAYKYKYTTEYILSQKGTGRAIEATAILIFENPNSFFISLETSLPARVAILATTMLTLMNKAANAREVA